MNNKVYKRIYRIFALFFLNYRCFGGARWYQYIELKGGANNSWLISENGKYRTQSYKRYLESIEFNTDDVVVDVGCNAGLFLYTLAPFIKKGMGVEISRQFFKQAQFIKREMTNDGANLSNIQIINDDILSRSHIFDGATTVLMSKVIYHPNLNGLGEKLLEIVAFAKVRRIIIQGHVSQGALGEDLYVQELLRKHGYETFSVDCDKRYPISVATLL